MLQKGKEERCLLEMCCIDELVPKDHLLRRIDSAVDFTRIYEITDKLYCPDNGRPNVDSVVLFKMVLIQHLYGLPSLRRTHEEIGVNLAYRWFLGYSIYEKIPHFSTVSYNFKHRYTLDVIDEVFEWILSEIEKAGYLSPEAVFIDGTHIKANANLKKAVKKAIPEAAKIYEEKLAEEVNIDRVAHGKKPLKDHMDDGDDDNDPPTPPVEKIVTVSTTDPECGVFHKGEHKKCFAYATQTGCDKNGYIMGVTVNPGNVHDSVAFDGLYEELTEKHPEIETIVADAGYKTPWICKRITDDGRVMSLPYKRPAGKEGFFRPYDYIYDEYYDCVICPENQVLCYSTTNREGCREFKSDPKICENCPSRAKCTSSKNCQKVVQKHLWQDYLELAEDYRHTPKYKELYDLRKETIERVFADAKEKYGMRFTQYRGLVQVTKWIKLKFAAMNLKKFAIHRLWETLFRCFFDPFIRFCSFFTPYPFGYGAFSTGCPTHKFHLKSVGWLLFHKNDLVIPL